VISGDSTAQESVAESNVQNKRSSDQEQKTRNDRDRRNTVPLTAWMKTALTGVDWQGRGPCIKNVVSTLNVDRGLVATIINDALDRMGDETN
jgi:hypothetical protein